MLRRAPRKTRFHLLPPPYKLWNYETRLRKQEIATVLGVAPSVNRGELYVDLDSYQIDRAQRLTFSHGIVDPNSGTKWRTWQSVLENGEATTARKDPKYVTHGIHPYKGKFYPQLAKSLLNLANVSPGSLVLDPFCGSGTVLLEAQLNGIESVGCDLNPLAALVSKAKTSIVNESLVSLDRVMKSFCDELTNKSVSAPTVARFLGSMKEEMDNWFPAPVVRKLSSTLDQIDRVPTECGRLILKVLLSSIIREVSHQEPTDLRIRRRKNLLKDAPVQDLLLQRVTQFRKRMRSFGERMSAAPANFPEATVIEGDVRLPETLAGLGRTVNCIVTSPPYATALPYIDTDRLSLLAILGIETGERSKLERGLTGSREIREAEKANLEELIASNAIRTKLNSRYAIAVIRKVYELNRKADVGFRRKNMAALLCRYFLDMQVAIENMNQVAIAGANIFFVIGDNKTTAGTQDIAIESARALEELATAVGWKCEDRIPISVTKENLLNSRNSITENTVLWFKRSID